MERSKSFLWFLSRCAQKDKEAWDTFVRKYGPIIYNYIDKTLKRYGYFLPEETVAEIFLKVFLVLLDKRCERLRNFRGKNERSFVAYLREVCFWITTDLLKEGGSFSGLEKTLGCVSADSTARKPDQTNLNRIALALRDDLGQQRGQPFYWFYDPELEISEIPAAVGFDLTTVQQFEV